MRLDKYLTEMGIGSRSEVKQDIKKGFVKINGTVCKKPETKVSESDCVLWKEQQIRYVAFEYIMLNKPSGVLTATEDRHCTTVMDMITDSARNDLFPVGRLDKDTEGLLLLTNDGQLAHRLLSPKHHVPKIYYAKVSGVMTEADILEFKKGIKIDDEFTALPAELEILTVDDENKQCEIRLEIYEGKFHQVKRMVAAVGKEVVFLKRLSMGPLVLDPALKPGMYRQLTDAERELLYAGYR